MKKRWMFVGMLAVGLLLALAAGLSRAQGPDSGDELPPESLSIAATVGQKISYQGTLTENGAPVDGARAMVFNLYSNSGCTTLVDTVDAGSVQVDDGLFDVVLTVDQDDFNGQGLWLEVEVGGTGVGCEEVLPVPYALSLRPGATIKGAPGLTGALVGASTEDGAIEGSLVQGLVLGGAGVYGMSSSTTGYGVYGMHTGGGYAGYFSGDVGQGRTDDGLVKAAAMVYCSNLDSEVNYSFNNVDSSITVAEGVSAGRCTIDFNFNLTNRYWSATSAGTSTVPTGVSCSAPAGANDKMQCVRWYSNGAGVDGLVMIVVY